MFLLLSPSSYLLPRLARRHIDFLLLFFSTSHLRFFPFRFIHVLFTIYFTSWMSFLIFLSFCQASVFAELSAVFKATFPSDASCASHDVLRLSYIRAGLDGPNDNVK